MRRMNRKAVADTRQARSANNPKNILTIKALVGNKLGYKLPEILRENFVIKN